MPSELKFGPTAAPAPNTSPRVQITPRVAPQAAPAPVRKFETVVEAKTPPPEPKMVEIKPEAPLAATTIQYAANPAPAPKRIIVVPESTLREMNCGRETLIKMHGYKGI